MSSRSKFVFDIICGTAIGIFSAVCFKHWFFQAIDSVILQNLFTVVIAIPFTILGSLKIDELGFIDKVANLLGLEIVEAEEDNEVEENKEDIEVKQLNNTISDLENTNDDIIIGITSDEVSFDEINAPEYYQFILDYLSADGFFNDFGNPELLSWDFEFMSQVGDIINRLYGDKITKSTNDGTTILATLVSEAGIYALVNDKNEVGATEIMNSIKNWTQYLNFNEKANVFNAINEETSCSYHPYHKSKNKTYTKARGNIIEFRSPSSHS